ncbi:TonB-dependent siderophore receptor [Photobacterium sp. CCB-ST2H9]|uniref:TonB-dependent siderophore receptor n=1 Tax=Photobacterium sp. CCB-ST2H9 TaxID=2912855 RepID=UPI002002ED78|nr:TonB-dependent siderophore receptor [Photobacterium sp. CCB-ST2H9]UTM59313.1 TonB-dependent siderophore receptor [Photobacterium sp. CCB-ST2H9]
MFNDQHFDFSPFRISALTIAIAASLSFPCSSHAAEAEQHLDEVVVWGAKVSSSSEFMTDEDISVRQADHLSDLLRDIPGVDVGGTHSVNQRINIRGLGETDLDIRLDGASQYANMFHHVGNLTLNPDIMKAVDVQVGANSVLNSGLGGSVMFETKSAKDLLRPGELYGARIFAGYGSNAFTQGSLSLYGQLTESLDALFYAYQIDRDNFKDGNGTETLGYDGTVDDMMLKLGWEPAANQRLQFTYDRYRDKGDYNPRPDMSTAANNGLTQDQLAPTHYDRDTFSARYHLDQGDALDLSVTLYQNRIELKRDESGLMPWPSNRQSLNTAENINTGTTILAVSSVDLADMRHTFRYGGEGNIQDSKSRYGTQPKMNETLTAWALYLEDSIRITDAFTVTPGLRYDAVDRDALTGEKTFDDINWALAADYDVNENLTLFASTRSLFKAPPLLETFVNFQDVTFLAEDIKPESGQNTQGGLRWSHHQGSSSYGTTLTVFKTRLDDYLANEYRDGKYIFFNNGDAEIKGFETSLYYGYEALMAKLSYARADNKNKTNHTPIIASNGRSSDVGDSIGLALDYSLYDYDLYLGYRGQFVLKEDNVLPGTPVKDSYDVHNIYAQWAPQQIDGMVMTFGIDNLFDEAYVSHASRSGLARGLDTADLEPGRNIKISASYQF